MRTAEAKAVSASEVTSLFSGLQSLPVLVLAVSGGPDSTALMVLAEQWRDSLTTRPKLIAVTVDHGLRKESKAEAAAVARLARELDIAHRTSRWTGRKPKTGLQEAARLARYRLLGRAARRAGATHIVTAHTLDDQAETVLLKLMRGAGPMGLGGVYPRKGTVIRPLLDVSRDELRAWLATLGQPWVDETITMLGKHVNVFADVSGLLGRPWQAYGAMVSANQYGVMEKLLFGSDFPYTSAAECIEALYSLNQIAQGTNLPVVPRESLRGIVERDTIALLGLS